MRERVSERAELHDDFSISLLLARPRRTSLTRLIPRREKARSGSELRRISIWERRSTNTADDQIQIFCCPDANMLESASQTMEVAVGSVVPPPSPSKWLQMSDGNLPVCSSVRVLTPDQVGCSVNCATKTSIAAAASGERPPRQQPASRAGGGGGGPTPSSACALRLALRAPRGRPPPPPPPPPSGPRRRKERKRGAAAGTAGCGAAMEEGDADAFLPRRPRCQQTAFHNKYSY